ncbi:hypothetical protein LY623_05935 [Halomonas sp. M5N1S15]|nr:helix-turn-helix domain-containing protein [Halomonas alkalisoli]MCE9681871.1 hypothetical protein [Halomonas alkalisoli]
MRWRRLRPRRCRRWTGSPRTTPPCIAYASWNVSLVARRLGVSRPTIYRRMRRHGLVPPNWREAGSNPEP